MSRVAAAGSAVRGAVTRRRIAVAVVAAALAVLAVAVASLTPGWTMRLSPFPGVGTDVASSGPLTVEIHEATLARTILISGDVQPTTGTFVVLDVTITSTEEIDIIARDLVIDGHVYDSSTKAPSSWQESHPAPGMPVSGQIVFEVDAALVDDGATVELRVAPGFDASGDLEPQVVVRTEVGGPVVDAIEPEVLSR